MNCRDYHDRWNELLDARSAPPADLERGLEAHASTCPRCASIASGYQWLRQGVSTLRPPSPSAESIERLYRLTAPSNPPAIPIERSRPRRFRRLAPLAAAAAAFALAWLGGSWWPSRGPADRQAPPVVVAPEAESNRALGLALAEATEATLVLAREASVPASRIGREMIDLSTEGLDLPADSEAQPAPESESSPSDLFRAVGERVGAGVRPLSGSARHAFSFLLGPPDDPVPAIPPKRDSL